MSRQAFDLTLAIAGAVLLQLLLLAGLDRLTQQLP